MRGELRTLLVVLACVTVATLSSACAGAEPPAPISLGGIEVEVADQTVAGDPLVIRVSDPLPLSTYEITLDDGHAPDRTVITTSAEPGSALLVAFDTHHRPFSGRAVVTVRTGRSLTTHQTEILPSEAVDPVDVFVGPRTLPAGSDQLAMLVVVPTDAAGNPVAAGTDVELHETRPDRSTSTATVETNGLLGFETFGPGTLAGTTRLGLEVPDAPSSPSADERTFLTVAGRVESLTLETPTGPNGLADGRSLHTVRTEPIVDVHGNPLPDGTQVALSIDGPDTVRHLTASTIDGVAEFFIEAPVVPGRSTLTARVESTMSDPLEIDFDSAVVDLPAEVRATDDGLILAIGRVRSPTGAYVADGTAATVHVDGQNQVVPLERGAALFELPADASLVEIEVLGNRRTIPVPPTVERGGR